MPEFLNLTPPLEALHRWLPHIHALNAYETLPTTESLGRTTAQALLSPENLPAFNRSMMDGYALKAADTYGASESLPAYLELLGEVPMGARPDFEIRSGQCALIHTGGMLPKGADAVAMLEHCQLSRAAEVEVLRPQAEGENIIRTGEDLAQGEEFLPAGRRVRAVELGGLMALGITQVRVVRRPLIGIISTGDEVIPPQENPEPGQVRDVNSYSLAALVEEHGGQARRYGIFADDEASLRNVAATALQECDALLVSAGSSASARDLTASLIQSLGSPGVLVHGINLRPGKPTLLGLCDGLPVLGLPGNPVSAYVVAWLFVRPMLQKLLGLPTEKPTPLPRAVLAGSLPSRSGREDWIPVKLTQGDEGLLADPLFARSNLIFSLVRADGLVRIPAESNGLAAGETVELYLLE